MLDPLTPAFLRHCAGRLPRDQVRPQGVAVPTDHRRRFRVRLWTARWWPEPGHSSLLPALQHHRVSSASLRSRLTTLQRKCLVLGIAHVRLCCGAQINGLATGVKNSRLFLCHVHRKAAGDVSTLSTTVRCRKRVGDALRAATPTNSVRRSCR